MGLIKMTYAQKLGIQLGVYGCFVFVFMVMVVFVLRDPNAFKTFTEPGSTFKYASNAFKILSVLAFVLAVATEFLFESTD